MWFIVLNRYYLERLIQFIERILQFVEQIFIVLSLYLFLDDEKSIIMKKGINYLSVVFLILSSGLIAQNQSYPIVDTGQELFYDTVHEIPAPAVGSIFYGQDACYDGIQPEYSDNGDGTVSDLVTGLMWSKSYDMDGDGDIEYNDKMSYEEALAAADTLSLAGYDDWRLPSIKEVYSLIMFYGIDPSGFEGSTEDLVPFINTDYFDFAYGDESAGERIIDAQIASSTLYVGLTMMGDETMFGVNFADGRIKGYGTGPLPGHTEPKQFYVMFVRGADNYGINDFIDNQDGTVTDNATGLMWTKDDDGSGMVWHEALEYAENSVYAGYDDWRLPNVKELQSIVDYTRAPSVSNSPAIDPVFNCTAITDEGGQSNYPFYWSGTTHANWTENNEGSFGSYVCFGEALGFMEQSPGSGIYTLMDVHGAGAQRSDPKTGNPDDYPYGNGPQGDVIRIYNFVRLVRDAETTGMGSIEEQPEKLNIYPNPASQTITVSLKDAEMSNLSIIDTNGRVVYETQVCGQTNTLSVSNLSDGLYIAMLENESGIRTGKFLIQK